MNRLRKRKSHNVLVRIIKKLVLILLIIGIPGILIINLFSLKKLEVIGTNRYKPEQITSQLIKTKLDSNALYLYLNYNYFTKIKLPFIEKIDLTMTSPHTITAYVYEKMVAGCVEFMGEYMYFDKDGIVVECSSKRLEDVPVIKGLEFSQIILSEKIELEEPQQVEVEPNEMSQNASSMQTNQEAQKDAEEQKKEEEKKKEEEQKKEEEHSKEMFNLIIDLTQLIDKYKLPVDTVTFNRNHEVILDCDDITVLLGKKSTYDEDLSDLKNILKEASGRKITIDMRKGTENIVGIPKK